MRFRSSIPDFQLANPLYRGAVVSFFEADDSGFLTDRLAQLFAGPLVGTRVPNPVTLDGDGKFFRPVYIDRAVIGVVSSSNVPSHPTAVIAPRATFRGTYAPGITFSAGDWVEVAGSETRLLIALGDFTATTLEDDIGAGRLRDLLGSAVLVAIQMETERLRNESRDFAASAEDDREQTGRDVATTANNRVELAAAVENAAGSAQAAAGSAQAAAGEAERAREEANRARDEADSVDAAAIAARFDAVEERVTAIEMPSFVRRRAYALNLHFGA